LEALVRPRLTPDISPERLQTLYDYDKEQGVIYRRANNRQLLPHPDTGVVALYDGESSLRKNLLYHNLAYVLGAGKIIPSTKKVLCLDLDSQNIRFHNLKLVDRKVYREIQTALRNLAGALNMKQHPHDKHAYVVTWLGGSHHKSTFYDISSADNFRQKKSLELVKLVNQHIRTT
jgi:hypothetical protein